MKYLTIIIGALFAITAQAAKEDTTIMVFGDSLTAPSYSWAELLDDSGKAHVQNVSRGGLKLVELDIPDWLQCNTLTRFEPDMIVLWLGTNDGFWGEPLEDIEFSLRATLDKLALTTCKLTLILPIEMGRAASLRDLFSTVLVDYPEVFIVDMPFAPRLMEDDVHQTPEEMFWQAVYIWNQWLDAGMVEP